MKNTGLFLTSFALILLVISCASIKEPSKKADSLAVFLITRGSEQLNSINLGSVSTLTLKGEKSYNVKITSRGQKLSYIPVPAGTYEILLDGQGRGDFMGTIEIPPASVVFFPYVLVLSEEGFVFANTVKPEHQELAMKILTDTFGFQEWIGSQYVGFGPFRPLLYFSGDRFNLSIQSNPDGANIFIDNEEWGKSPMDIKLVKGKYLVRIEKDGYKPFKQFINLNEEQILDVNLEEEKKEERIETKDSFEIVVMPFLNLGKPEEAAYSNVIQSTLAFSFDEEEKLTTKDIETSLAGLDEASYPDFTLAEEAGADLLVAGQYQIKEGKLFVYAVLYEVKSERIKYAQAYISRSGLVVFEAIDEIALEFVAAVSNVLPEAGEPIIEKTEVMSEEMIAYEKELSLDDIIKKRLEKKNALSIETGLGGFVTGSGEGPTSPRFFPNAFKIKWERIFNSVMGLYISIQAKLLFYSEDNELGVIFNAHIGPQLTFRSERVDFYLAPLYSFGFLPNLKHREDDYTESSAFIFTGLDLDIGIKSYLGKKISSRPKFLSFGIMIDLIDVGFSGILSGPDILGISALIYLGLGIGL
jgi:TolB-like protein